MNKILQKLMLSCQKATEMIEKKMYFRLSRIEEAQLLLHTSVCKACKGWQKQSKGLHDILNKHIKSENTSQNEKLSGETKSKITESIKNIKD